MKLESLDKLKKINDNIDSLRSDIQQFKPEIENIEQIGNMLSSFSRYAAELTSKYSKLKDSVDLMNKTLNVIMNEEAVKTAKEELDAINARYEELYKFLSKDNCKIAKMIDPVLAEELMDKAN